MKLSRIKRQRHPHIKLIPRLKIRGFARKLKIGRKHAHNCVAGVIERDGLPGDVRLRAKTPLPRLVTQNDGLIPARPIFLRQEIAPLRDTNA